MLDTFRIIIMNFPVLQENVKIHAVPAGRLWQMKQH